MERTMSVEDKIRRAEEIYNRRRENEYKTTNTRVRVDNKSDMINKNINRKLKKMIIQIIICMLIYFTFYYIVKNDYIFSTDFKNKCEEILSYDISFSEMYKKISDYILLIQQKLENTEESVQNKDEENKQEEGTNYETQKQNNEENAENSQNEIKEEVTEENIGGAVEEVSNIEQVKEENLSEEEQMQKDAEDIKSKIGFIKPLSGTITSVFGWRNPKSSIVSKYHTGIDIAANQGTDIISATNGNVVLASSEGAYGNHLKIQIDDITIIYAHCLTLEVKEGDQVNQGQIIAKVGSTGNSTGPHLHFEIRKEERYVNPELILNF